MRACQGSGSPIPARDSSGGAIVPDPEQPSHLPRTENYDRDKRICSDCPASSSYTLVIAHLLQLNPNFLSVEQRNDRPLAGSYATHQTLPCDRASAILAVHYPSLDDVIEIATSDSIEKPVRTVERFHFLKIAD